MSSTKKQQKRKKIGLQKKEKSWAKYEINLGTIQGVGNAQ